MQKYRQSGIIAASVPFQREHVVRCRYRYPYCQYPRRQIHDDTHQ